jgi:hypothetical protein
MYNSSVFESIKSALEKSEKSGNNIYKEILKFKPGNTYVVRLLPNIKNPDETFFKFFQHSWNSFCTGEYINVLSLQTFDKQDPINLLSWKLKKSGTPEEKAKAEKVQWSEQVYVNVYVVDDPTNPENNGTVKIFRFGRNLKKIIESGIKGEDSDEFGAKVYDLSPKGVNFKIKVEKQGDYPNYSQSRFTSPSDLGLSKAKQEEIYNSLHNLKTIISPKTEEELIEIWNKHFICEDFSFGKTKEAATATSTSTIATATKHEEEPDSSSYTDELSDDAVSELLKGLQD